MIRSRQKLMMTSRLVIGSRMYARPVPDPANDNRSPRERLRFWLAWSGFVDALLVDAREEAVEDGA